MGAKIRLLGFLLLIGGGAAIYFGMLDLMIGGGVVLLGLLLLLFGGGKKYDRTLMKNLVAYGKVRGRTDQATVDKFLKARLARMNALHKKGKGALADQTIALYQKKYRTAA